MKTVFVSFVFEDKAHFDTVVAWAREGRLGPDITAAGELNDVRQGGDAEIERHLRERIRDAATVLVLVGANTHNHDWVRYELSVATSQGKKVIAARIPGTTGPAPQGFRHLALSDFSPDSLRQALS